MPTTISLIRHGLVHNPNHIFYGRLPRYRLGEEGREQAKAVMTHFQTVSLEAVFSSPLLRARQTAKIILSAHPQLNLRISKQIIEVHTPYDGQPLADVAARGFDMYTDSPPEFEQPVDIMTRMTTFMNWVRKRYEGKQVIAVTHGDNVAFSVLWAHQIPLTIQNKQNLTPYGVTDNYPEPASISQFTFHSDDPAEFPVYTYTRPYK